MGHRTDHYVNKLEEVNVPNVVIGKMSKHLGYENQASFKYLRLCGRKKTNEKGDVVEEYEHMLKRCGEYTKGATRCLHLDNRLMKTAFRKIIGHIAHNLHGKNTI